MQYVITVALALALAGCYPVSAAPVSKWSAETRCRDLRPDEIESLPDADLPSESRHRDQAFSAVVWSEYGRTSGKVVIAYRSDRREKQLAELNVLECTFLDWLAHERTRMATP